MQQLEATVPQQRRDLQAKIAELEAMIAQQQNGMEAMAARLQEQADRNPKGERAGRNKQIRHRTNPPWWSWIRSD